MGEGPPIRYRKGPLQYWPTTMCYCRKKAALWISCSDDNPGYATLPACVDGLADANIGFGQKRPHSPFIQELVIDLRKAFWNQRRKNTDYLNRLGDAAIMVEEHKEVRALRAKMMQSQSTMLVLHQNGPWQLTHARLIRGFKSRRSAAYSSYRRRSSPPTNSSLAAPPPSIPFLSQRRRCMLDLGG
ncbi:unnamed protein product [Urochloa humidicola]